MGALLLQYGLAERMCKLGFGDRLEREVGSGKNRSIVRLAELSEEASDGGKLP